MIEASEDLTTTNLFTYKEDPGFQDWVFNSVNMKTNLTKALLNALKEIENPTKNTKNPFLKNNYADINAVLSSCKEILLNNGVMLIQGSRPSALNPQWIEVYTKLIHGESGETLEETVVMQPKENSPQGSAGLLTYGRRYSLFAALGLAAVDDDDDGNVASVVTGTAAFARPVKKG
jgi:hypothetical protein